MSYIYITAELYGFCIYILLTGVHANSSRGENYQIVKGESGWVTLGIFCNKIRISVGPKCYVQNTLFGDGHDKNNLSKLITIILSV